MSVRDRLAVTEELGHVLYEKLLQADPCPGDVEWFDLSDEERESYSASALAVIRFYEAAMSYPEADL